MADTTDALALAQRLRHDARETDMAEFARLFLRTAEELEEFVRRQHSVQVSLPLRGAG